MRRALTPLVLAIVSVVVASAMPAAAAGPVTVTWERNWGTYNGVAPYAAGEFNHPVDVAADKWGNVYVAGGIDGDNRIQMFDADGAYIKTYDNGGTSAGQLSGPYAAATDRWGNIYVGQYLNERIEVFGPGLWSHAHSIDVPFVGNGITGLAVGLDGTIFNVRYRTDLQVRDRQGALIAPALTPPDPIGVGVSQDGEIYVALDEPSNMLGVYHPDLTLKWAWGGTGTDPGYYDRPWEAVVDGAGNIFVSEFANARVQVLSPSSEVLSVFGNTGTASQLLGSPTGIAAGLDRTVYVCDYDKHRIAKWKVSTASTVAEIEGDTRYTTAVAASEKAYPDPDAVDIVVLATGANWPDALGGAALAGTVNGPLLLTTKDTLPTAVADEIARLEPKRVYVLGGSDVVSDAVMDAAKALTTMDIATRLEGPTRYETAIAIADEVKAMLGAEYDGTAFVCTGENFPDALAVSPIAAANGWPIYLTPSAGLPTHIAEAMITNDWGGNPSNHGYIIGGESAVSSGVEDTLSGAPFIIDGFMRIWGDTRYETAAEVADIGFDGLGMLFSRPAIATGENFPDALAGGVLQGSDYSVMVLTRGDALSPEAAAVLSKYKDHIYEIRFLGGSDVVTPAVRAAARALLW